MKAGTTELFKFLKLQRRLGESKRGVVGLLDLLWLATAKNCPSGNIGQFDNEEIAIMLDWGGDPDALVDALVDCKWVDRCDEYRLVVHDWLDHCPMYVRGNLEKKRLRNATPGQALRMVLKDGPIGESLRTVLKDGPTKSSQVKSIQVKSSESAHAPTRTNEFLKSWERWKAHSLENGKRVSGIAEETQLQRLFSALPNEADAIKAIEFSIERNARNLITNGDSSLSFADRPQKLTKYQKVQQAIAAMKASNE